MAKYIKLDFKRYSDDSLLAFAKDVVQRMLANPAYPTEQDRVTAVDEALTPFQKAMSNASEGGRTLKNIRTEKRELLLMQLQLLAMQLDLHIGEPPSFFTATGFLLRKKPVKGDGLLPQAVLKYVRRTSLSGVVEGEAIQFPDTVRQIAVEHSMDGGATWQNGTYASGKRFRLYGLTPRQDYLVRVCFHGTRQRTGNWSEPMGVFVL